MGLSTGRHFQIGDVGVVEMVMAYPPHMGGGKSYSWDATCERCGVTVEMGVNYNEARDAATYHACIPQPWVLLWEWDPEAFKPNHYRHLFDELDRSGAAAGNYLRLCHPDVAEYLEREETHGSA